MVRRWLRAWDECDGATLTTLYHENATIRLPGGPTLLQGIKGVHLPGGEVVRLRCVQIFAFEGDVIIDLRVEYDTLEFAHLLEFPPPAGPAGSSGSSR